MTVIAKKPLPHGSVPVTQVRDVEVRKVLMKICENVSELARQLRAAQEAILELQRRK